MMSDINTRFRDLPSVDQLLAHERAQPWLAVFNRDYVVRLCRETLDALRREIAAGTSTADRVDENAVLNRVQVRLDRGSRPHLSRVVNASGTVLHTNFGRALLADPAIAAVVEVARAAVNLEYDLARGARGRRESEVERLLTWLTGAEAATVVNNNAAAVLVAVNTAAAGKEVVVSRGELVEIGGAFRIPEIIEKSGARLREVGTTNRTHPADYERAIGPNTGLLLKVHTSNYRIVGFSSDVPLDELVEIGRRHALPVMEDLGSGALVDLTAHGLPKEPLVSERVAMGADLVTCSGDKLLGGPQAGLLLGTRAWIGQVAHNPLHRAVRCDKMTLAALEATLRLYQQSPDITRDIPTLALCTRSLGDMQAVGLRAQTRLCEALGPGFQVQLEDSTSQVGSGALPTTELPSKVLAVTHHAVSADKTHHAVSADKIAARFRSAHPPIIGRIEGGRFLLDLRTIFDADDLVPRP